MLKAYWSLRIGPEEGPHVIVLFWFLPVGSLCRRKTPECDRETSVCTDVDGIARCQCKLGYFQFNMMDHSCRGTCEWQLPGLGSPLHKGPCSHGYDPPKLKVLRFLLLAPSRTDVITS